MRLERSVMAQKLVNLMPHHSISILARGMRLIWRSLGSLIGIFFGTIRVDGPAAPL